MRLCAVDIGSNAIKMRIVEAGTNGARRTLAENRFGVRLGDSFGTGLIPPDILNSAAVAFEDIAAVCKSYDVQHIRAVATSATREAANGNELTDLIERRSGIPVHVITGTEEGRLLASGVRPDLVKGRHNVVLDVGGGSTELIYIRPDLSVTAVRSLRLGAVRLSQMHGGEPKLSRQNFTALKTFVEEVIDDANLPVAHTDTHVVGVAGTIGALVQAYHGNDAEAVLTRAQLNSLIGNLTGMTPAKMEEQFGIDRRRGQIILPGAMIVAAVMELFNFSSLSFSGRGLRDGIIDELVESALGIVTVHHRPSDFVSVGEKYDFNSEHALHVEKLSLQLFDGLRDLHKLNDTWRESLRTAAVLHDIGKFISYSRHHKHSRYLISSEELPGLNAAQQQHAAAIARYHRKAVPSESHPEFNELSPEGKDGVFKCAALLRLADVLDRQNRQAVSIVSLSVDGASVWLHLQAEVPVNLEVSAASKKTEMFEKVFKRRVQFQVTQLHKSTDMSA